METPHACNFLSGGACACADVRRPANPRPRCPRTRANEVQRLSEGLPLLHAQGREGETLAQYSARKGASLPDERRQHIADLVRQAAAAGEQGDGQGCVKGLGEARVLLREAGLGSSQPGPATYDSPAGAGSAAGEANLGGAGSTSTPARSPSSNSAGSMGLQGAGSAGAASDAVGSGPTSPTERGGVGDTTTGGSTSEAWAVPAGVPLAAEQAEASAEVATGIRSPAVPEWLPFRRWTMIRKVFRSISSPRGNLDSSSAARTGRRRGRAPGHGGAGIARDRRSGQFCLPSAGHPRAKTARLRP